MDQTFLRAILDPDAADVGRPRSLLSSPLVRRLGMFCHSFRIGGNFLLDDYVLRHMVQMTAHK